MDEKISNSNASKFYANVKQWREEMGLLREIIRQCNLTEDFKWMKPCYMFDCKNVLIVHGFKDYCAILFTKGSLLKDPKNKLIQQTENVQAGRQLRFKSVAEINEMRGVILAYIAETIELEKAGVNVEFKKTTEYKVPPELEAKFAAEPEFKEAFERLTPGRQRGYLYHFSSAKQSKTVIARIEKLEPKIYEGLGFDE